MMVTKEILEHFLSNCPLLERLDVAGSQQLVNLKVVGSSLQLKYLQISGCMYIASLEVYAPKLVTFKYIGRRIELNLRDMPLLHDVSFDAPFDDSINFGFIALEGYFSQLERLYLTLHEEHLQFPRFPELTNLRHLTFHVFAPNRKSLLGSTSLIEAAPFLQKIKLELCLSDTCEERELLKVTKCPNQYLKESEIVGFKGCAIDIEFAIYLLDSAFMLERIICNPRSPNSMETPWEHEVTKQMQVARKSAEQLRRNIPQGAKLLVL